MTARSRRCCVWGGVTLNSSTCTQGVEVLTLDQRWRTCVHEAAHAVVHALGGAYVYGIAVAPVGACDWQTSSRKGGILVDLWGVCHVSDCRAALCLEWDEAEGCMIANRGRWRDLIKFLECQSGGRAASRELRRQLRAWCAGTLAGPVAEAVLSGQQPWIESSIDVQDDAALAEACAWLLPFRSELDGLLAEVHAVLSEPKTWQKVLDVARRVERAGELGDADLAEMLPLPRKGWPPAPRKRPRRMVEQMG